MGFRQMDDRQTDVRQSPLVAEENPRKSDDDQAQKPNVIYLVLGED